MQTTLARTRRTLTTRLLASRRDTRRRGLASLGRADLHVHSTWSDGAQSPEAIVRAAAGHLDVVAITDHDEIRGASRARAFAAEHPELGVDVVVGEEVSTLNGHLIGLWLRELVPPGLSALRTIELVHAQGGVAVAAHPFHPIRGAARGHPSSDAHDVWYLGSALTRFAGRDGPALRSALRAGSTRAQVAWSWSADKLPRHLRIQLLAMIRFLRLYRPRLDVQAAR